MANIPFNNEVIITTGIVKWFYSNEGRGLIEQVGDGKTFLSPEPAFRMESGSMKGIMSNLKSVRE